MSSSDLYECIFVLVFIGIFLTLCLASLSKRAKSLRRNLEVVERKLLAMSIKSEKWRGRAYVEAQRASRWFVVVQSMLETARNVSMEDTKTGGSSAAAGASSSRVEFSSVQLRLESEGKGLRDRIILTLEVPSDESGTLRVFNFLKPVLLVRTYSSRFPESDSEGDMSESIFSSDFSASLLVLTSGTFSGSAVGDALLSLSGDEASPG